MTFLEATAKDIIEKYGTDLSRTIVVFPNKRASLFLNECLVNIAKDKPIWAPQYTTISDLFRSQSQLVVADHIKLVIELYKVYVNVTGRKNETLDEFYSWGELLLSDFDDIDKNEADSQKVFQNTADLHRFDTDDFLTDEQKAILKRFFNNFTDNHESELKKHFEELWNRLYDIYQQYHTVLREQGIAYEGMLYRDIIERGTMNNLNGERYLFVGFNLLQKVEQDLFSLIMKNNTVKFYWDYDEYYCRLKVQGQGFEDSTHHAMNKEPLTTAHHEAGQYIKQYLPVFPNELSAEPLFQNFEKPKDISYISASTEDMQARYVSRWLTPERIAAGKRTAIVLCNEKLLPTVINCLPDEVKHVNITSGYPLTNTPVYTLIRKELKQHGKAEDNTVFCDRLMEIVKAKAQEINRDRNTSSQGESEGVSESLFRMYTILNRLRSLIENDGLDVDTITFQRLLIQICKTTTVPFHGEPIIGIQIMGVLETRNLDFDHILILSCNEGNMPKGVNDSSFIPHAIRKAYGLTTVDNKVAIYAYYFHRLLQRASDIEITYNSSTEDGQTGEKSRFMIQLLAESNLNIQQKTFSSSLHPQSSSHNIIEKDDVVMKNLIGRETLSPSALNHYLRCPLYFYYKVLCGFKDDDDEELDFKNSIHFGNVFHATMENIYRPLLSQTLSASIIESIIKDKRKIEDAIDDAIHAEISKVNNSKPPAHNSQLIIIRNVIKRFVINTLEYDKACAPITIKGVEKPFSSPIVFNANGSEHSIKIYGKIDRIDVVKGPDGAQLMRIVDYKTGRATPVISAIEEIFNPEKIDNHSDYYLQTMLYSIVTAAQERTRVAPALLYPAKIKKAFDDKKVSSWIDIEGAPILTFGPNKSKMPILDAYEYVHEFDTLLKTLLSDIFNKDKPFTPTEKKTRCTKCFFANLCK